MNQAPYFAHTHPVSKATLALHLAHDHRFVYPPVAQLKMWKREELVLAHEDAHAGYEVKA